MELLEEAEEEGQAAAEPAAGAEVVVSKEQMRPHAQGRKGAGAASAAGSKL